VPSTSAPAALPSPAVRLFPCFVLGRVLSDYLVQRRQGRQHFGGNFLAGQSLDLTEQVAFVAVAEGDRQALLAHATGASDSMDVGLGLHGEVKVEDVRDVIDIESAGRDIGRYQHSRPSVAE